MIFDLLLSDPEQAEAVFATGFPAERCFIDFFPALTGGCAALASWMRKCTDAPLYLALPYMTRQEAQLPIMRDLETFRREAQEAGFAGMLLRNFEQFAYLTECAYPGELLLDAHVYVWNPEAYALLREQSGRLKGFTLSPEMSAAQWRHLAKETEAEASVMAVVYGYLPLMVSAGCVRENEGVGCSGKRGEATRTGTVLTDRTGRRMQVTCDCRNCYNVIWNAHRLSLHDAIGTLAGMGQRVHLRLDFTRESGQEAAAVCAAFLAAAEGKEDLKLPYAEYTTGRLKKGVE